MGNASGFGLELEELDLLRGLRCLLALRGELDDARVGLDRRALVAGAATGAVVHPWPAIRC